MNIYELFLFFILYSFFGWIWEEAICSVTKGKFLKRGFGVGPLCFVYGSGAVCIIMFLDSIKIRVNTFTLFLLCGIVTCTVEYITSFFMEKAYKKRWWDYSYMKYNINGRVCLLGFIIFGVFSVLLLKYVHPFFLDKIHILFTDRTIKWFGVSLFVLYIVDMVRSIDLLTVKRVFDGGGAAGS